MCDCTRKDTLTSILKWKSQVDEKVQLPNGQPLPILLLVNKCDIEDNGMTDEDIQSVCQQCGIKQWMRVGVAMCCSL